jgi:hypothetical protein
MADSARTELAELFRRPGAVSTGYADVSGSDTSDRNGLERDQNRAVSDALIEAGAPAGDVAALEQLFTQPTGAGGEVSRFAIVRDGQMEVDEILPGPPIADKVTSYGPVPNLVPLLIQRPRDLSYVVAEVGRDGGDIRLYQLSRIGPLTHRAIEGDTQYITKVNAGGWSQGRYQRDAEQIWKRNEKELAEAIDEIVRDNAVELLVVSGDVRARQLLIDQLAPASRDILSVVAVNTRADGASDAALEEDVRRNVAAIFASYEHDALERLATEMGHGGGLSAAGVGAVVHSLQQSQVDVLMLDPGGLSDTKLFVLDGEPWVATAPEEALGARQLGRVSAADALIRAAFLTDARVVITSAGELPGNVVVAAILRWPTGPAVPGA